ncbi:hypothetical protein JCM5350_000076 [Sporobolomyces pararoseus]
MSQSTQNSQQTRPIAEGEEGRETPDRHASNEGGAVEIQKGEEGQQSGTEIEPNAKRIKIDTTTSGEGSTPVQAKYVDIPFDLWLMIGEHLEPLDLVHLTRVNKSLRRLLRSRSDSARVWKLAFKNVNLPTLKATDWDLVYLASFCFEKWACFGCEFYIPSEVKAMNDYLHHLDSTTTASRDRQLRKAAREARDKFVSSKKECVEARFEWLRWYTTQAVERRRRAEELRTTQERAVRLEERFNNIRSRLLSLGHEETDLKWLERDARTKKDQVLTESEWDKIAPGLVQLARGQKMKREKEERAALEPTLLNYYTHFDKSSQLSLVCSMQDFGKLPAVNQLIVARSSIGDSLWQQVVPSIQRRIDKSRRNLKLSYARPLAHALNEAGHPLPQQLFDSLFPAGASSTKPADYWRIPSKINLASQEDVASPEDGSTISDVELDTLLSRFTSRVFCGYLADRHQVESFRKVVDLRDRSRLHSSGVSVSAQWIKILFLILKVTGIKDGEVNETLAKVDALGNVWSCQSDHSPYNKLNPFISVSELVQHLCHATPHARALNPHYSEGSYPISSVVYTSSTSGSIPLSEK